MVKIALAGCGQLARDVHLPLLLSFRDVKVVAMAEPHRESREAALKLCPEARPFSDLAEVWSAVDVDAVVISTPPISHAPLAMDAIQRRKHVYVEKPLTTKLVEAAALVATWKRLGVVGMVGFNYRFHRLIREAHRLLQENAAGIPLVVSTVFTSSVAARNTWRGEPQAGGGVLLDLGSHHIDLIHFLFDEAVVSVLAQTSSHHAEGGTATLQMRLKSGLLVNSCFSFGTVDNDRIEVFGDAWLLRVDRNLTSECEVIRVTNQHSRVRQLASALSFARRPGEIIAKFRAPGHELSYRAALKTFVDAAATGVQARPDFEDGYRSLAVLSAAQQSAATGQLCSPSELTMSASPFTPKA